MALRVDDAVEVMYAGIVGGLRSGREDAGLSQPALASRLSVRSQAIWEWEARSTEPTLEHLMLLALALERRLVIVDVSGGLPYGPLQQGAAESWGSFEQRRLAVPLRERREALGLTQPEVAQLVGVSKDSIQRWELVRVPPRPMALMVWAHKLECSVELWPVGSLPGPAPRKAPEASAGGRRGALTRAGVMALRVNATVERRLRRIRSQLGEARSGADLSLGMLGAVLGVTARTVRDWERCYEIPSTQNLIEWACMLGSRLAVIEPGTGPVLPAVSLGPGESLVEHEVRRLARWLKKRRVGREISQTDLALIVGVTRSSLQRWEDGAQVPLVMSLMVWADRLGCTVDLVRDEGVRRYGPNGSAVAAMRP